MGEQQMPRGRDRLAIQRADPGGGLGIADFQLQAVILGRDPLAGRGAAAGGAGGIDQQRVLAGIEADGAVILASASLFKGFANGLGAAGIGRKSRLPGTPGGGRGFPAERSDQPGRAILPALRFAHQAAEPGQPGGTAPVRSQLRNDGGRIGQIIRSHPDGDGGRQRRHVAALEEEESGPVGGKVDGIGHQIEIIQGWSRLKKVPVVMAVGKAPEDIPVLPGRQRGKGQAA